MAHISESTLEDVRKATFLKASSGLSAPHTCPQQSPQQRLKVPALLTSFAPTTWYLVFDYNADYSRFLMPFIQFQLLPGSFWSKSGQMLKFPPLLTCKYFLKNKTKQLYISYCRIDRVLSVFWTLSGVVVVAVSQTPLRR